VTFCFRPPACQPPVAPTPPVPPQDGTWLVDQPDTPIVYSAEHSTDARTALTQGLAEYLSHLAVDWPGGRRSAFNAVFATWAEPEENADHPMAAVYTTARGEYQASKMSPGLNSKLRVPPPDGRYLISPAEFVVDLTIEMWALDPKQRMALVSMLEDALSPHDWRYGLLLSFPHYHNARGTYEMLSSSYDDSPEMAVERHRIATFIVRGRVPVLRLVGKPLAKPAARVEVLAPQDLPPAEDSVG